MKKKIFKYIKVMMACILVASLTLPSYAAVSASDGSAFVTKAEFDAALSDFNARLTTFEAGINSKIDSQVSSYLDRNGIWNGKQYLNENRDCLGDSFYTKMSSGLRMSSGSALSKREKDIYEKVFPEKINKTGMYVFTTMCNHIGMNSLRTSDPKINPVQEFLNGNIDSINDSYYPNYYVCYFTNWASSSSSTSYDGCPLYRGTGSIDYIWETRADSTSPWQLKFMQSIVRPNWCLAVSSAQLNVIKPEYYGLCYFFPETLITGSFFVRKNDEIRCRINAWYGGMYSGSKFNAKTSQNGNDGGRIGFIVDASIY